MPGDVHSALLASGVIPDPYMGRNEDAVRWVARRDWTASRALSSMPARPGGPGSRYRLSRHVAECALNGNLVLSAETASAAIGRTFPKACAPGENTIEIPFHSTTERRECTAGGAALPHSLFRASNCPIPNGNMLRKPQCHFGWDWNIALAPLRPLRAHRAGRPNGRRIDACHASRRSMTMARVDRDRRRFSTAPRDVAVTLCDRTARRAGAP